MSETRDGTDRKTINLALQGGGSHGAFAWGVLDRILEDERIVIEEIVGTSAGAMNAVVTAYGLTLGGNEGARQSLRQFWEAVAEGGTWSVMQPSWLDRLISPGSLDYSPGWIMMDTLSRVWSPYQMNPANYHPLRDILNEQIDFETLLPIRQSQAVRLREQRVHQSAARLRPPRHVGRRRGRFKLHPFGLPGGRDQRRVFLGWRLHGKSADLSHHLQLHLDRHTPHHGEPDSYRAGAANRASYPRSNQYAEFQLEPDAGNARD